MSDNPVHLGGEAVRSHPRYPRITTFLRKWLPASDLGQANPPDQEIAIMNQHVNRRDLATTSVATVAVLALPTTCAAAAEDNPAARDLAAGASLSDLMDAYNAAHDRWEKASFLEDELSEKTDLLAEKVQYGYLRQGMNEIDGTEDRVPLFCWSHDEIDSICDRRAVIPLWGQKEAAEAQRARLHAQLDDIETKNRASRAATGLDRAEEHQEQNWVLLEEAKDRIMAHRPSTFDEYRLRDSWLADYLSASLLTEREQDLLFGFVTRE